MALKIGEPAPDFTLVDTEKKMVTLAEQRGKNVVLLFFPAAFTSTCTKELCQTRDEISFYQNLNAQTFGISMDMLFTLAKYKEEQNLNFPLLSDFNKDASRAYDSIFEDWFYGMRGVSKRSVFLIDKDGILRYQEVLQKGGEYPDFDALKKALESLN